LKKGNYEFTLTGKTSENLTDTLTLGFQVVDSLQTKGHTEFFSLEKNLALKAQSDSPVTLVFADYQKSLYLDLLWRLKMAGGERIDQKIAQVFGDKLMAEYFPELSGANSEDTVDFLKFQVPQGGIAILPYGDSDLELSVKLVALLPEVFDRMGLVNYFSSIVNDPKESRERAIIALAGLGVLNEPVLHELSIVNNYQDLTVKEQLYLSFALMELGDENNAKARLKPLLAKTENLGSSLRLNTGVDQDDILEATAIMALLAEGLNFAEEADKLLAYVLENNSQDILLYPEKLLFLEKALPKLSKKPVSFSYKLDNKKEKVTLTPEKTFSLILTLEKIKEIEFSDISGQVGVSAYYELPFTPPAGLSTDGVKVTRQYEVTGKATNELKMNDLVRVKIAYQFGAKAPDGPYKFIDFLPAGLKIVHRPFYRGVNDKYLGYPVEVNGQKAVFYIYGRDSGHFTYYARVINPGRFRAEQGILEHGKSGVIYSVTEKGEVNIK
ncbi:MAG: alpha-2-macroglobulin, partial [Peptococcales bacterium]